MRVPTLDERFVEFLESPSSDCWEFLRDRVFARSDFDPYASEWQQLEASFAAREYGPLLEASDRMSPMAFLSARFHFLAGVSALETGDSERAKWHRRCSQVCLRAILDSGDGTVDSPYLSTYPWDCYDVLQALGEEPMGQQLVDGDGRWCDVLTATSGEVYWFDVTDLLERRDGGRKSPHGAIEASANHSTR